MTALLFYPLFLMGFWYKDFSLGSIRLSLELLVYAFDLLSVPPLIKTFFKPLKNEYRQGLVMSSIFMGIVVKSILLSVSALFLACFALILIAVNLTILLLPGILIWFVVANP